MTSLSLPRRATCPACLRPQRTCICQWVTRVEHVVEIVILQHPLEVNNAKGSARLLHLCLPHSRLVVGEVFAPASLQALLHAPLGAELEKERQPELARQAVLLYPETPDDARVYGAAPPPLEPGLLHTPERIRLIVLDGTWRKSRKMLHLNPLLQHLPRLPLTDLPPSRYGIRKAHQPHQLSTLEASCYALMQLEQKTHPFLPLLQSFDRFVAQQASYSQG